MQDNLAEPSSETQARLAALGSYDILDTPAEAGFDDLVLLASQICGTPVALVSLVAGDRQWFKAKIGFDGCETPISQSVCQHGLAGPSLLIIPDLTVDPRTRDNPLVTSDPHIRFYAGARIETSEGLGLGMLCVIDGKPRPRGLSEWQATSLAALARQVSMQMELRRVAATHDKALQSMRDGDARHRQILDSAIDYAIITIDLEGLVTSWNTGAEKILGWTEAEMCGRPAGVFFTAEDEQDRIAEREMRLAREHGRGNDERWHVRKDGSRFWALGEMMPLTADDGRHVGYLKILRDRTEQRRSAEALQQQADLLRTVTDHVSEAIFQLDTAGIVKFANPTASEMLGWSNEDLVGENLHDLAHHHYPDGRPFPAAACELVHALPVGKVISKRETVFFRRNGTPINVLVSNSPVNDGGGIAGAVLTVVDITATKAAAEHLRRADERLNFAMQASAAVGWWDWDIPNDKFYAGESFARFFSVDPHEAAAGLPLARFVDGIHPDDRLWVAEEIQKAMTTAGDYAAEYRLLDPDGTLRWLYARGRCFHDANGAPSRFPGVGVDITERKRSEERQSALVELGDRLRDLSDPIEMAYVAAEITGRTLGLSGAAYGTVDQAQRTITIGRDWCGGGSRSVAGLRRFDDYGSFVEELLRGETVEMADIETDPRARLEALRALGVRAFLNIPLIENGRLMAVFCLFDSQPRIWSPSKLDFLRSVVDRTRAAIRQQEAEAEQALLNQELSHRMKNLLAMVQAIASQTMRSASDVKAASSVLTGRLIALSHAHDLLLGGRVGATMLEPIVRGALANHGDRPDRFRIAGPEIRIGGKAAMALALMVHELATNATKYGSLSADGGLVDVEWKILDDPAGDLLRLSWIEIGGPPVTPPTSKGFGSRFIERGLAATIGGTIEIDYPPTGVTCVVQGPLASIQANE